MAAGKDEIWAALRVVELVVLSVVLTGVISVDGWVDELVGLTVDELVGLLVGALVDVLVVLSVAVTVDLLVG